MPSSNAFVMVFRWAGVIIFLRTARSATLRKKVMEKHPAALALAAAVLFFLCTAFLATDNYNPFLYFRF